MPTLGTHIPESSPLLTSIMSKVDELHGGNVSLYIKSLIKKDLSYQDSPNGVLSNKDNVLFYGNQFDSTLIFESNVLDEILINKRLEVAKANAVLPSFLSPAPVHE